jgi:hypothetical protein
MIKLNAVESEGTWRQLPVGQQVHERYTALAKHVLQFEKQWFQGWRDNVDNAAMRYLKQPIFTRQGGTGEGTVQPLLPWPRLLQPWAKASCLYSMSTHADPSSQSAVCCCS